MNKDGEEILCLKNKSQRMSEAKTKEGIFVGPQIRIILRDSTSETTLNCLDTAKEKIMVTLLKKCWMPLEKWTVNLLKDRFPAFPLFFPINE
jgi:hypothetical protein